MTNEIMVSHLRQIFHEESRLRRYKIAVDVESEGNSKTITLGGRVNLFHQKQVAQSLVQRYIAAHKMNGLAGSVVTIENNLKAE